jgi:sigma-B regulation protein RsbU (phosphoserine phosphatase)
VDLQTGELVGASAGHHPLLRLTSSGETSFALSASGPPIGVLADSEWQDETLQLNRDESVLLYTDGVSEARAGDTRGPSPNALREYGEDRIAEIVQGLRGESPKTIVQSLHQDVLRYTDPQSPHDDCTSAMLRYGG